jgi:hypothetical protein
MRWRRMFAGGDRERRAASDHAASLENFGQSLKGNLPPGREASRPPLEGSKKQIIGRQQQDFLFSAS